MERGAVDASSSISRRPSQAGPAREFLDSVDREFAWALTTRGKQTDPPVVLPETAQVVAGLSAHSPDVDRRGPGAPDGGGDHDRAAQKANQPPQKRCPARAWVGSLH